MSYAAVRCPKCGAGPGEACLSVKRGKPDGQVMRAWPYRTHKKRRMAYIVGAPSTELFAVPVRVRTLKRRSRVGAVDSAIKTLP